MIKNQKTLRTFRLFSGLIILNVSFILSAIMAQSWGLLLYRKNMFVLLVIQNLLWSPLANSLKIYDEFINWGFFSTTLNLFKLVFVQTIVAVFFIFIYREGLFTRIFIIENSILLFLLLVLNQYVLRKALKIISKKEINLSNLAIVGKGKHVGGLVDMLKNNPQYGFNYVGLINDDFSDDSQESRNKLENYITTNKIEAIIIAPSTYETDSVHKISLILDKLAVRGYFIPDYSPFLVNNFQINYIGEFQIISLRSSVLDEFQSRLIKRMFDLFFAIVVLVTIGWWLFPLIFIILKLTSRESAIFIQKRVGQNNKEFNCFKFRTMYTSPQSEKFLPTQPNDPRITPFGKFLRRSNLDELPQIINVLLGDMSLVGPRPHTPAYNNAYEEFIDEIKLRHLVKPGITGWAQVHGLRGDVEDPEINKKLIKKRIENDLWYIENWSFLLDVQIILLTIWKMIRADTKGY